MERCAGPLQFGEVSIEKTLSTTLESKAYNCICRCETHVWYSTVQLNKQCDNRNSLISSTAIGSLVMSLLLNLPCFHHWDLEPVKLSRKGTKKKTKRFVAEEDPCRTKVLSVQRAMCI